MTLKKTLIAAAALAFGLSATAALASKHTRTYVSGNYKYTCVAMGSGEYCGNFNVISPL
jgi:hypothetical protein